MVKSTELDSYAAKLSAALEEGRPNNLAGAVGITTYISETLRRGQPFSRKRNIGGVKKKTICRKQGMHVGRRVDNFVRQYIVSGSYPKKTTTPAINCRVNRILNALVQRGIKPCAAQVLVVDRSIQLMSYIDAIGTDRRQNVWAIEIKCTTEKVAAHEQLYNKGANKNGKAMVNGMQDTERNHHFLQSGFGAHALRQTYRGIGKVRPCVIVCCVDGVRFYEVPHHFSNPLAFASTSHPKPKLIPAPKRISTTKKIPSCILRPWPHDTSGIMKLIYATGYVKTELFLKGSTDTGTAILLPASTSENSCGLAVCISRQWLQLGLRERQSVIAYLGPAVDSIRKRAGSSSLITRAIFAPSIKGEWELAFLKRAPPSPLTI